MAKFFSIVILLLSFYLHGKAQVNTDSLLRSIRSEPQDTIRLQKYLSLMEELKPSESEFGLLLGNVILAKTRQYNLLQYEAKAHLGIGIIYMKSLDFVNASVHLTRAMQIAEANSFMDTELNAVNYLAHLYFANGQYAKAEEYNLRTIEGCKKYGIIPGIAAGYGSLGAVYYESADGNPVRILKAIECMHLSIKASLSTQDTLMLIGSYMSIAKMQIDISEYDSSLFWLSKAEELILLKSEEDSYAYFYLTRGAVLLKKRDFRGAILSYTNCVAYSRETLRPEFESSAYKGLYIAYKELGDYKKALFYIEKHTELENKILSQENFAIAADIQNKYQREKKDKEILKLNKDKEIQNLQIEAGANNRNRLIMLLFFSFGTLLIFIILLILIVWSIRSRRRAYTELQRKNIQIQEQAVQLGKQTKLIAKFQSQMNPHFVFNALHNIQGLVIGNETKKASSQIQSLAQLMRKTFANAEKDDILMEEEISYLNKYVDFEMNAFESGVKFSIEVGKDLEGVLIPPMMIQPFIENAIKHAELNKVSDPFIKVSLNKENNLLAVTIEDNGIGIRNEESNSDKLSHSMSVIKSRIELFFQNSNDPAKANVFTVESVPQIKFGTRVKFYLPLNYSY